MTTNKADSFVGYEYKEISVNLPMKALYIDCLSNFGWELIEEQSYSIQPVIIGSNITSIGANVAAHAVQTPPKAIEGPETATLRFKRNRRIEKKHELNKLESKCEESLKAVMRLGKKNDAQSMGVALGTGILGTGFLALGVYNFLSSNIALCIIFAVIGFAGWGIGFLSNRKMEQKKSAQSEPQIQAHLDAVHNACEQAHALLVG